MTHTSKFFFLLLTLNVIYSNNIAQSIGIGTASPDASAKLDISSTDRGLLIPRVSLSNASTFGLTGNSNTEGMMVYNTNTSITDGNGAGFYFWNGTSWKQLSTYSTSTDWALDGNTNGNLKSIGTNDNNDFPIETNGTERMRISSLGYVGIGQASPNCYLDIAGDNGGTTALLLRSGNMSAGNVSNQITFGYNNTTNYRHAIKTRHNSGSSSGNAIDFYVWYQGTDAVSTIGTKNVLTIDGNHKGMIGIGTTQPKSEIHISDGNASYKTVTDASGYGASILITDNNIPRIYFEDVSESADNRLMSLNYENSYFYIGSLNDSGTAWEQQNIIRAHRDGNVGIGTSSPANKLHVNGSGNFGTGNTVGTTNALAIGNNNTVSGSYAIAGGTSNTVSSNNSVLFGSNNNVTNSEAGALGYGNTVSATRSFAFGSTNNVSNSESGALGYNNTVSGSKAYALGATNTVAGNYSIALNQSNTTTAAATTSIVGGFQSYVSANLGLAIGYVDTTTAQGAAAFGFNNNATAQYAFTSGTSNVASGTNAVAFGSSSTASANQAVTFGQSNTASGTNSITFGQSNVASANQAVAFGQSNTVSANNAAAFGQTNIVSGVRAVAFNQSNTASGNNSFAAGYTATASANLSVAFGNGTTASGDQSTAFGVGNTAPSYNEFVLGTYATTYTPSSSTIYNNNDRIFNIGNGINTANRADAFTILKNGNIGIGVSSPTNKLEVNGKTKTTTFQMTNGATNGYILQSDASGNGTWVSSSSIETDPKVSSATTNYVPKWNGTTLTDGIVYDNGTNIGIGTNSPSTKLEVSGTTKTTTFQMTNGATNGYVLQSDASGNGTWVNATSLSITETDPKVSATTTNLIPKWNGTTLTDGNIYDDGTVTIGYGTPSTTNNTLQINGSIAVKTTAIITSNNSTTLDGDDYMLVYSGITTGNNIALPTATTYTGRIYIIVNHSTDIIGISTYYLDNATTSTTVAIGSTIQLVSDGINWHKIN